MSCEYGEGRAIAINLRRAVVGLSYCLIVLYSSTPAAANPGLLAGPVSAAGTSLEPGAELREDGVELWGTEECGGAQVGAAAGCGGAEGLR